MLAICVVLPELGNLFDADADAWRWNLTTTELSKAILCSMIAHHVPTVRTYATGAAIWFLTQAADEFFNGNLFTEQTWEYPLLAANAVVLWILQKRTT